MVKDEESVSFPMLSWRRTGVCIFTSVASGTLLHA